MDKRNIISINDLFNEIEDYEKKYSIMFSSELLKARKDRNITQKELSELSGIPQKTISRIESGKDLPNVNTIIKLVTSLRKEIQFNIF